MMFTVFIQILSNEIPEISMTLSSIDFGFLGVQSEISLIKQYLYYLSNSKKGISEI